MGLFAQAARELRGYRLESFSPQSTAYWVAKLFGGGSATASGISVTADKALTEATIFAACRNIAEDLAGLPLPVYRGNPQGNNPADLDAEDPGYAVLNRQANPEMSAFTFKETIHGHVALRGDGFAEKELDRGLRLKALWPLNPARTRMARNGQNGFTVNGAAAGRLFFIVTLPSGEEKVLDRDLVFHPRGFGPDGLRGYSLVALFAEAIGLSLGTEEFQGRFFGNDASPGAVLTYPKTLSDKARTNIEKSWQETHQGLSNANRIAILEEGLSVSKVGIDPIDAQLLETRKFQRDLFGMVLRMPPDKLGNYERSTYNNLEQSDINYVRYTLRPRGIGFEQQLIADGVLRPGNTAVHDYIGLLQGDALSRAAYYHSLRQDGAISGAGIARMENFPTPTDPAADQLLIPLNMQPVTAFGANGLTLAQTALAAYNLLRAGYVAKDVNEFLGMPAMAHTGIVPGKATDVPSEAEGGGGDEVQSDSSRFLDDKVGRELLAILQSRKNGHHPEPTPEVSR